MGSASTAQQHEQGQGQEAQPLSQPGAPAQPEHFEKPELNKVYPDVQSFEREVKGWTEQQGHRCYTLGGQGRVTCRIVCRNWKKPT